MKQQREGRKVVNWHRPLAAGELSRRYLRTRAAPDPLELQPDEPNDFWWEEYDGYWDYFNCADDIDYSVYAAWNLLQESGPGYLAGLLDLAVPLIADPEPAEPENAEVVTVPDDGALEIRLRQHLDLLASDRSAGGWLVATVRAAHKDLRDVEVLRALMREAGAEHEGLLLKVLLLAPFWIRRARTWQPPAGEPQLRMLSLVDHLFVRYPVPPCLYPEWLGAPDAMRLKWLCWFILYGQGRSLYRAAAHFDWQIHRKFQRDFDTAPAGLNPTEACMFAEIMRLGGSPVEFARLRQNPAFAVDPTAASAEAKYLPFWRDTVVWLAQNRDAITDEEAQLILAWAMHEYTELRNVPQRTFSLRGRSMRRVLDAAREYRREVEKPYAAYVWRQHGWDWVCDDGSGIPWTFVELTKGVELMEEGKALHHCVAGYAGRCVAGYSAIVSMRRDNVRQITVEVSPHGLSVVQARGLQNRAATRQEQAIIDVWVRTVLGERDDEE